eukprot:TRINITY_DN9725_c0_g1_i2.p1 TRINITY_DN9725_c0_g1~~TRINITY_DN9725_c0_g1_i2.p1  ORF type:complete len:264 (-),score=15.05 TRINITY_DN9725_c0_g1_i2:35-826(-)
MGTNELKEKKIYRIVTEKYKELCDRELELKPSVRAVEEIKICKVNIRNEQLLEYIDKVHSVELEIACMSMNERLFLDDRLLSSVQAVDSISNKENMSSARFLYSNTSQDMRRLSRGCESTQNVYEKEVITEPETNVEVLVRKRAEKLGITLDSTSKALERDRSNILNRIERTRPRSNNSHHEASKQTSFALGSSYSFATSKQPMVHSPYIFSRPNLGRERPTLKEHMDFNSPVLQALSSQRQLFNRAGTVSYTHLTLPTIYSV